MLYDTEDPPPPAQALAPSSRLFAEGQPPPLPNCTLIETSAFAAELSDCRVPVTRTSGQKTTKKTQNNVSRECRVPELSAVYPRCIKPSEQDPEQDPRGMARYAWARLRLRYTGGDSPEEAFQNYRTTNKRSAVLRRHTGRGRGLRGHTEVRAAARVAAEVIDSAASGEAGPSPVTLLRETMTMS